MIRLENQKEALQDVMEVSQEDVTASETALAQTILRMIQLRCAIRPCNLYIFSNHLDRGWKELIETDEDFAEMGRQAVYDAARFDPSESKTNRLTVWGFGFNELNGEAMSALREQEAIRLESFWTGFFEAISDEVVSIGFEMPQ